MKQSKSMAYLRQLCCLGLGKDVVIPEFLDAVRDVIPSNNNLFARLDDNGVPAEVIINIFHPEIVYVARSLIPQIHTPERNRLFNEIFKKYQVVTQEFYFTDKFCRADFYHLVLAPCEQHYFVIVPVYANQQIVELLWLCRPSTDKPFTLKEQQQAAQLSPYLTHALQKRPDAETSYADSGETSMIIANTNGDIVYLAKEAKRLLTLATQLECYKSEQPFTLQLPPALIKLCHNLDAIFKGEAAMPPLCTHINPRGKFVFRAYWLDKLNHEPSGLIGIIVDHQEPQDLIVMRALRDTVLSPVQQQVCLLITQGLSNEQIGQKLHIKLATVKDHVQKILLKMDIHHRTELLPKLLKMGEKSMLSHNYAKHWH